MPLVIHIPGITDKKPQTIETVGGQIDIRPTLMNLLGIDTKDQIQFGNDLLSDEKLDFTVLRDGALSRIRLYIQTVRVMTKRRENR